jgi:hypothetical protein
MNRAGIRVMFALALLSLPGWLLIRLLIGEPYPGLYLPQFGSTPLVDGIVSVSGATATVHLADGTAVEVDPYRIIPADPSEARAVFNSTFSDPEVVADPRTAAYLRERFGGLGDLVFLEIDLERWSFDASTGDRVSTQHSRTVRIQLDE